MRKFSILHNPLISLGLENRQPFYPPRRLSENSNFFQNQGLRKKLPQAYSWYRSLASSLTSEDNFLSITQSLGKRAFSDSLLVSMPCIGTYFKAIRVVLRWEHRRYHLVPGLCLRILYTEAPPHKQESRNKSKVFVSAFSWILSDYHWTRK